MATALNTQPHVDAILAPPRLPYHPAIEERFAVSRASWKALVEAVYPSAKTADSVIMALSYCKARNLDPFKRPVHIVPMWSSEKGGYVETVWPGIAELRTTAFRTKQYAGCDATEFGPYIERDFTGQVRVKKGREREWENKTITVRFPEWCRITVYRLLGGERCKFVGPTVKWLESYATVGKSEIPNDMWCERPEGQIEKCAEAAALRKAFPEELGNDLTAEEMTGRFIDPPAPIQHGDEPPEPKTIEHKPQPDPDIARAEEGRTEPGEVVWEDADDDGPPEPEALAANGNGSGAKSPDAKKALLAEVEKLADMAACFGFAQTLEARLKDLFPPDRAEVRAAFIARQTTLNRD